MLLPETERTLARLVVRQLDPAAVPAEQWEAITQAAYVNGLSPMLVWVVHQRQPALLQAPAWKRLVKEAQYMSFHTVQLEAAQAEIERVLSARGIGSVWLKGIALSQTIYPAPDLRPMSDIDVLVPFERREEARAALLELGYQDEAPSYLADLPLVSLHHYRLMTHYRRGIVELHYRLLGGNVVSDAAEQWLRQQIQITPQGWAALAPEAQLLHLCAHHVLAHNDEHMGLVRYLDIDLLLRAAPVNWDVVLDKAGEYGLLSALHYALEKVITLFDTPIPEAVRSRLHTLAARQPALVGVGDQAATAGRVARLFRGLSFRQQLSFARRLLAPPPAYMRQRYPERAGWPLWALSHAGRGRTVRAVRLAGPR
jgi:hypothetical protein